MQRPGIIGGRADWDQWWVPGVVSYGRSSSFMVTYWSNFGRFVFMQVLSVFLRKIHFALEIVRNNMSVIWIWILDCRIKLAKWWCFCIINSWWVDERFCYFNSTKLGVWGCGGYLVHACLVYIYQQIRKGSSYSSFLCTSIYSYILVQFGGLLAYHVYINETVNKGVDDVTYIQFLLL
jgi:hypothetical protein